jgi:capsular polysaccharide biosynthesis protein
MNLAEYGRIIVRRGWIMLLLAAATAAATFLLSQQMTPLYRATQTVLMTPSRTDNGLTLAVSQQLNNRVAYLDSDQVAATIIDRLQLDMAPAFLRSRTTVVPNRDNLTIQIDVDLEAPNDSAAAELINPIAAAWGQELIRYQDGLNADALREDRIRAQAQDAPRLSKLRPNVGIYTAIGAIAGFLLGAVLIFVLEFLESAVIRRREDISRSTSLPVLATVPTDIA